MTTIYCMECRRPIGKDDVPHEDLQLGGTIHFHQKCWKGVVQERVVTEYVMLIMRVAGQRRLKK